MTTRQGAEAQAATLRRRITSCRLCPRLVDYRGSVAPRSSYASQEYWRRPVAGFGDLDAKLLVLGLAPATHGGFRTGRIFTGDASSRFLVSALHAAGFANQAVSESLLDGLAYSGCYLTAAVKCAPPGDRPLPSEIRNCAPYLDDEIRILRSLTSILALGSVAFRACVSYFERSGVVAKGAEFSHGRVYRFNGMPTVYASYHPSPRNTNTGRLTTQMLVTLLRRIKREL